MLPGQSPGSACFSSTPRRRTARPGAGGPSSRAGRWLRAWRETRCSASGPGTCRSSHAKAALGGVGLLVVVGGDGSVNEVANGLVGIGTQPDLAVIARGTGWDFVRTFGIPRKLEQAVRVALEGDVRTIDLGRVSFRAWDGSETSAIFANVASAGMSGAIAKRANETTKGLGGKASYLWATFAVFSGWQATDVELTVDGERRTGRMFDVVVANGRFFGGGLQICPEAEPDDALFDVLTIGDITKRDLLTDDAEDLPRDAPPAPEGRAAARPGR